jgi:hypothetical protein
MTIQAFNRIPMGFDLMPGVWMRDNTVIIELYTFIKSRQGLEQMIEIVKRIKHNWLIEYWCFDYSAESHTMLDIDNQRVDIFKIFQEQVINPLTQQLNIHPLTIHLIHGDLDISEKYAKSEHKRGEIGSVAGIARFFNLYHKQFHRIQTILPTVDVRDYTSFNRRRTAFRQKLYNHLRENNLLDKGYSTFRFENYSNLDCDLDIEYENKDHVLTENILTGYYSVCNYEIVVETASENDNIRRFITEKTLRPLAHGVPFILLAAPHTLSTLHGYGFKTYHDIWDESYDTVLDHDQRFNSAIKLISQLTPEVFAQHQNQLDQINSYNRARFLELANIDYRDAWYSAINSVDFFERIQQSWATANQDILRQQSAPV